MAEWRQRIADELQRSAEARFVAVYTCPPGDAGRSSGACAGDAMAEVVDAIHARFVAFNERGRGRAGMDVSGEFGCAAHAPLIDTAYRSIAGSLERELLAPRAIEGIVVAHMTTPGGDHVGWIALGSNIVAPHALDLYGASIGELAQRAAATLSAAFALAQACGYRPPMTQTLAPLTPREREIAWLVASGLSDINIASRLSLSEETIGAHLRHIYRKLEIHSRVELAARLGALDP